MISLRGLAAAATSQLVAETKIDDLGLPYLYLGTGGLPKEGMTSHGNIMASPAGGADILLKLLGLEDEVFLNFLPLSHADEHTAGMRMFRFRWRRSISP